MIAHRENRTYFTGSLGNKIFFRTYAPAAVRAGIVIAHGIGEHSGRYAGLAATLRDEGFALFASDHQGHGQSEGRRGHIRHFHVYLQDIHTMVQKARRELSGGQPLFMMGHSLGGLIAIRYIQTHPASIDGAIVSSPALGPGHKVAWSKRLFANLFSIIWPRLTLANGLHTDKLSHDSGIVNAYRSDPLVHDQISVRCYTEVIQAMTNAFSQADKLQIPLLMQVAGADRFVDPNAARRFFETCSAPAKDFKFYPDCYHEIYNESSELRKQVITDLTHWLNDQVIDIPVSRTRLPNTN